MSIIDTIVSALRSLTGGGTGKSTGASGSTGPESKGQVSTEYDPASESESAVPDVSTEAAVKGSDAGADDPNDGGVAAGTDATASTGTLVDQEAGHEPAEAVGGAGGVDVDRTTDESDVGLGEDGTEGDDSDAGGAESTAAAEAGEGTGVDGVDDTETAADSDSAGPVTDRSTEPVETITGIGPAYGGRLAEYGIGTVGELAAADAADVAEGIDVSESRVSDWVERANDAS
jgi:predicted flap endonuclease-1-like 5' DNA nuclease